MNINCSVPSFNNLNDAERLDKIQKYLYDLDDQLRFILSNLEVDNFSLDTQQALQISQADKLKAQTYLKEQVTGLKQRIIATAHSIETEMETIREQMTGMYSAISDYGTYKAEYVKDVIENATGELTIYQKVEDINGIVETINAYIRTGELEDNVFGIEIGETQAAAGFKLRLVKNKISFYENGFEVAYISGHEIVIDQARIKTYIFFGGFRLDCINGIALIWDEAAAG
ncbi:MAG: hypothetical protein J6A60_00565 [Clostridia bacterium]|nr:hypothetical protein [Clostridia bacterium]